MKLFSAGFLHVFSLYTLGAYDPRAPCDSSERASKDQRIHHRSAFWRSVLRSQVHRVPGSLVIGRLAVPRKDSLHLTARKPAYTTRTHLGDGSRHSDRGSVGRDAKFKNADPTSPSRLMGLGLGDALPIASDAGQPEFRQQGPMCAARGL